MADRAKSKPPSWKQADDAKLLKLFRKGSQNGGIDHNNTHYKYIKNTVLPLFFPERVDDFKNFGPLFRKKAAKFEQEGDLFNARAAKQKKSEEDLFDEDNDGDYEDESQEEDIDLDESFEEEDEDEDEEDEDDMPPKKASKKKAPSKSPARKPKAKAPAPAPAPAPAADVDDVADRFDSLGLQNSYYDLNVRLPHLVYPHTVEERDHVTVEVYGLNLPEDHYRPTRDPDDTQALLLGIEIPGIVAKKSRQERTHAADNDFTVSTSKNTAYKKLAGQMQDDYDDGSIYGLPFVGNEPQVIRLPFPVKEEVTFSMRHHRNRHPFFKGAFPTGEGEAWHQQFHTILAIECIAIKKPKARTRPNVSIVESSEDEEEVQEDDNMAAEDA